MIARRWLHESRRSDVTGSLMQRFNFILDGCKLSHLDLDGNWGIETRYHPNFEFLDMEYNRAEKSLMIIWKKKADSGFSPEEEQFEVFCMPTQAGEASRRWNNLLRQSR